jgi:hypothetical protein
MGDSPHPLNLTPLTPVGIVALLAGNGRFRPDSRRRCSFNGALARFRTSFGPV